MTQPTESDRSTLATARPRIEGALARIHQALPDARRVAFIASAADVPAVIDRTSSDLFLVTDFEVGEQLIARCADSRRVVLLPADWNEGWLASLPTTARDAGVTPPTPVDVGERCLVILPTYNERENLEAMVRAIRVHLACDILVVDDNSPDGTGALADTLAAGDTHLQVLHRAGRLGLGKAYLAGFAWGLERDYTRLFEMDCDFSHPPWDLARLARASAAADLVVGSRFVPGGETAEWALGRVMLSRTANMYTRTLLGFSVKDWTAGFRCYRADLLRKIPLAEVNSTGYSFQIEMTWRALRAKARIREVPIRFVDRIAGTSKMNSGIAWEAVRKTLWLRVRV